MPKQHSADDAIRNNLWGFYQAIDMPGGYSFSHVDTLRLIDLYYNSKFKTGQYDEQGLRKFFYNIVKPTCDIATKFIDLDTKDIILVPERANDELKVWVAQRRLKQWLKDEKFGDLLNEIAFDLPKYGSVVLKKKGKYWCKVNIQNLRMDVAAKSLKESGFVYELVKMSRDEIEQMDWDKEQVRQLFDSSDEQEFLVYDCYVKKGKKWKHFVKADLFCFNKDSKMQRSTESQINVGYNYLPGLTLDENTVKDLPYRELHWERVPGRWLGFGFVEYLEDNQVAINEAENLERKGLAFKALNIWQTRDDAVGGQNVLTGARNGDILRVDSEVTPLQKDNSDLSAYNNTRTNWTQNTERKTFSTDITTGASLPSRTPLGVANLQASFASSYFELKRENFGLFVKSLLLDDVIPSFESDTYEEHQMVFLGSDEELDKLDRAISDILVGDAVLKYAEKTGFFPAAEQRKDLEQRVLGQMRKRQNRYLKIPKGFYEDAHYSVDVLITGENVDNGTRSQVIQLALNILGTNPGVLQNPVAKTLMFQLLSLGGISPVEIGALNQSVEQQAPMGAQQPQVAGSIAAPRATQGMTASTTQL